MARPLPSAALTFAAALLLVGAGASGGLAAGAAPQRIEQAGIALELSLSPANGGDGEALAAGADSLARIRLMDAGSGAPLAGARPKAWIVARRSEAVANELECAGKIRSLASGSLAARPDVDLNSYFLLTLNSDKTISVINPQISFAATKLESLIVLPGNGAGWALSKDARFLYVSIPDIGAVAVVDMTTRRLAATLPTGEQSRPTEIKLQPDGRYVWVGLDGAGEAVAIDTGTNTLAQRVAIGGGLHRIAFTGDGGSVFFSNGADDSVSIVDTARMRKTADVKVGKTPVALAYGSASRRLYVAAINAASIAVIDVDAREKVGEIPVRRGIAALAFEPSGRYVLALNQFESTVTVIDSAVNQAASQAAVVGEPDQIAFTQRYAYVRGLASEKFTLLDLNELRSGKAAPVDIQAGRQAPTALPDEIGGAPMIAATPEGDSVLIANGPDATLYYYQEGMMAPSGTLSNYKRVPRGLMVLDRSLRETASGEFTALVRLPAGGRFDVAVLIDQPRMAACFQVEVAGTTAASAKAAQSAAVAAESLSGPLVFAAGANATLAFKLYSPATGEPITAGPGMEVTVFKAPGLWQRRLTARQLADGLVEVRLAFPEPGRYNFVFHVPRSGGGGPLPLSIVEVKTSADAASAN